MLIIRIVQAMLIMCFVFKINSFHEHHHLVRFELVQNYEQIINYRSSHFSSEHIHISRFFFIRNFSNDSIIDDHISLKRIILINLERIIIFVIASNFVKLFKNVIFFKLKNWNLKHFNVFHISVVFEIAKLRKSKSKSIRVFHNLR